MGDVMAARRHKWTDESETATATHGTAVVDEPTPAPADYTITFNSRSRWLPPSITMAGCKDDKEAKRMLFEHIERSIVQIERRER